jgi:hypothetical protein
MRAPVRTVGGNHWRWGGGRTNTVFNPREKTEIQCLRNISLFHIQAVSIFEGNYLLEYNAV